MLFPDYRPRRMRRNEAFRRMIRETRLSTDDLILPLFVVGGKGVRNPIPSMPGQYQLSVDNLVKTAREAGERDIPAILIFGLPDKKDPLGTGAYAKDGIIQKALRELKNRLPGMMVITDVCLCEYTDHGHCGLLGEGDGILNDASLPRLAETAVSHARAGADVVAPSAMMDGQVAAIRSALDEAGFQGTPVMSYSAKYASAWYGPFRDAADGAPSSGDRTSHQMDPGNAREASLEHQADVAEGADILMVKPGLAYLDVLARTRDEFPAHPLAVYNVSGEYAMVKAGAGQGWIDERSVVLETLLAFRRAGADIILTYHALDAAAWLASGPTSS